MKQRGVIYNIGCKTCGSQYIGETAQLLEDRIKGHKGMVNSAMKYPEKPKKNGIAEHIRSNQDHEINWDETKILAMESSTRRRKTKEGIFIQSTEGRRHLMNLDSGNQCDPSYWGNELRSIYYKEIKHNMMGENPRMR